MASDYKSSEINQKALAEAKQLVQQIENGRGETHSQITKNYPSNGDPYRARVRELAHAYADVSDGKGGFDNNASSVARRNFGNVLEGRQANGMGFSNARIEAGNQLRSGLTKGAVGLALAGLAGIAAASEPDATPTTVGRAMAWSAVPGLKEASEGQLCKAFGVVAGGTAASAAAVAVAAPAVAVGTAATVGTGGLAAPLVAVGATAAVAGTATVTYGAVAPAAEAACEVGTRAVKAVAQKLGLGGT